MKRMKGRKSAKTLISSTISPTINISLTDLQDKKRNARENCKEIVIEHLINKTKGDQIHLDDLYKIAEVNSYKDRHIRRAAREGVRFGGLRYCNSMGEIDGKTTYELKE